MDGAEEAGYQTEKYILNELNYSGCQGCNHCKSAEECRIIDDLSGLLEDIRKADAVVFGSLIYFYIFFGQFKPMEDRMYSFIDSGVCSCFTPGMKAMIAES